MLRRLGTCSLTHSNDAVDGGVLSWLYCVVVVVSVVLVQVQVLVLVLVLVTAAAHVTQLALFFCVNTGVEGQAGFLPAVQQPGGARCPPEEAHQAAQPGCSRAAGAAQHAAAAGGGAGQCA